jgi:hypothetical protein
MQKLWPEAAAGAAAWLNLNHNLPNKTAELKRETAALKYTFPEFLVSALSRVADVSSKNTFELMEPACYLKVRI